MLRDAAELAAGHIGAADSVQQRGLAMVDVAHDGDNGRARLQHAGIIFHDGQASCRCCSGSGSNLLLFLGLGVVSLADLEAQIRGDNGRRIKVDDLVDRRHDAVLHQLFDDFHRADAEHLGQVLDGELMRDENGFAEVRCRCQACPCRAPACRSSPLALTTRRACGTRCALGASVRPILLRPPAYPFASCPYERYGPGARSTRALAPLVVRSHRGERRRRPDGCQRRAPGPKPPGRGPPGPGRGHQGRLAVVCHTAVGRP